jgi:hypothetical protein
MISMVRDFVTFVTMFYPFVWKLAESKGDKSLENDENKLTTLTKVTDGRSSALSAVSSRHRAALLIQMNDALAAWGDLSAAFPAVAIPSHRSIVSAVLGRLCVSGPSRKIAIATMPH